MNRLFGFLENSLLPIAVKIANNKHLTALKDSFVYTMPFLIVGSFVLLLINLPLNDPNTFLYSKWYVDLMAKYKALWVQPFYVSMGVMSLFVAFGIGYSLSNQYKLNGVTGGFLTLFTFLMTSAKMDWIPMKENDAQVKAVFGVDGGWMPVMDGRFLDAKGLFTAILGSFLAIEIYRFLTKRKLVIKLPASVPPAIIKSFELLTPIIAIILIINPINILVQSYGYMLPDLIMQLFKPLIVASDTLPATIFLVIIVHVLWFCGIHGVNVIVAVINPIILANLATNQEALQAGQKIPKILAGGFLDAFVYLGGAGATLGLAIAMSRSKLERLNSIGKVSIVPGIFNINEPVIFGAPIVANPILFIPFIGVPLINTIIAWFATKVGLVGKVVSLVPWTTPSPIAAFLATNLGITALILSCILIFTSYLLYLPFIKIYEKSLIQQGHK